MKKEFPYKPNDIVTIYADWENERSPIGTAKLVSFHKQGRTFILEDMYPEDTQIVYNWQEWLVEFPERIIGNPFRDGIGKIRYYTPSGIPSMSEGSPKYSLPRQEVRRIRYIDAIGIANSADDDWEPGEYEQLEKDRFLAFNGKEIY